ncbi:hypothetical protein [Saccharothrix syringae]|nr:hypothetical protein [Saccharothrix syringae]
MSVLQFLLGLSDPGFHHGVLGDSAIVLCVPVGRTASSMSPWPV